MRIYLENDGRVRVVQRDGELDLPHDGELDAGPAQERRQQRFDADTVSLRVSRGPHDASWPSKDELLADPRSSALLRQAISASLFRPVVAVLLRRQDDILLVRPSRGLAKDRWILPGGFVEMWEQPDAAARRETREEVGLVVADVALVASFALAVPAAPWPMLTLVYETRNWTGDVTASPDEIAETAWVPLKDALERVRDPIARQALGGLVR